MHHPDLAWEFLAFHFDPNNYIAFKEANNSLPHLFTALDRDYVQSHPWMVEALTIAAQYGRAQWTARNYRGLISSLREWLPRAASGEMPVDEALYQAEQEWNQLLAEVK